MKFTFKSHLPHGITPLGDTGPFDPAYINLVMKDGLTVMTQVLKVPSSNKVSVDLAGVYRVEDVISLVQRESCPEDEASASGSASGSPV